MAMRTILTIRLIRIAEIEPWLILRFCSELAGLRSGIRIASKVLKMKRAGRIVRFLSALFLY